MAKETFKQAFKAARDSGVRYFYWNDKKYTTRHKEEDPDEKQYDKKKKYPKRHSTWGEKKDAKVLDYEPQSQQKKPPTLVKGSKNRYKEGGIIQHD